MVAKQSARLNIGKIPKGIGLGLTASIAITVAGAAIGAWLLSSEKIGEGNAGYITVTVLLLSSVAGSLVAVQLIKEKRVPVCLIIGGSYLLSLLAITALFFGGTYSGVGESALVILAGALSVALLGLRGSKSSIKTRRR